MANYTVTPSPHLTTVKSPIINMVRGSERHSDCLEVHSRLHAALAGVLALHCPKAVSPVPS